jgi:diaminopimelate epimerase
MSQFFFTKLSGAGNDFILFDMKLNPDLGLNPHLIRKFCDRRKGIGADGIIVFNDSEQLPFEMIYYNADGSTGSLCANGARCSLQYAFSTNRIGRSRTRFKANGMEYQGEVLEDGLIKFFLNPPQKLKERFKIKAAEQLITASFINTGSPHVVIKISDVLQNPKNPASNNYSLNDFPVNKVGNEIRCSKDFEPGGTNVNFIEIVEGKIKIRTYERGVEDETLACGTGSVGAAIISFLQDKLIPPLRIIPKSGEELIVDFKFEGNKINDLSLIGPAKIVYKGEILI